MKKDIRLFDQNYKVATLSKLYLTETLLSGIDYTVAYLSKRNLTVKGMLLQSLKLMRQL